MKYETGGADACGVGGGDGFLASFDCAEGRGKTNPCDGSGLGFADGPEVQGEAGGDGVSDEREGGWGVCTRSRGGSEALPENWFGLLGAGKGELEGAEVNEEAGFKIDGGVIGTELDEEVTGIEALEEATGGSG